MTFTPTRDAGLQRLSDFLPRAGRDYAATRNADTGQRRTNVSQLSPWLHAGLLSEREVLEAVLEHHSASAADKFISEVFWRIYFKGYLEQRPSIWSAYKEGRDEAFAALDGNSGLRTAYEEAVEGRTGIEAFDHWARELVETGYLHNHARMWFASIWIFTLKLDWHLGADFFLAHLIDGDAASNTLSWRWVGGLHTKGKTYLARASNIARYTADHSEGPLEAKGLAGEAPALEESTSHERQALDLPGEAGGAFEGDYALLLHDEAASHVVLDLPHAPKLVITVSAPEARSPKTCGELAVDFARTATRNGGADAGEAFGCEVAAIQPGEALHDVIDARGIDRLACPYLPVGWTRDTLETMLGGLAESDRLIVLLSELDRATWPYAKAGFFGVKKKMESAMREAGIAGA